MHLLSYSEDANRIDVDKVYRLQASAEVTQVSSSPYDRNVVALSLSTLEVEENKSGERFQRAHPVSFFKVDLESDSLMELAKFSGHQSAVHSIVWEDTEMVEG